MTPYGWPAVAIGAITLGLLILYHHRASRSGGTRVAGTDQTVLPAWRRRVLSKAGTAILLVTALAMAAVVALRGATVYFEDRDTRLLVAALFLGGLAAYLIVWLLNRHREVPPEVARREAELSTASVATRGAPIVLLAVWTIGLTEAYWDSGAVPIVFPYLIFLSSAVAYIWQAAQIGERDRRLLAANQALADANEEIQEATRHKSEFLSRMSHDLRTPMNAIIGYTRILLRRLKGDVEERQYRNLENIQTSADNLLILINEILDLSRIEAGRIELRPEPVDLGQLVGECITSVAPLVKPGVELVQELDEVSQVSTDPDRIRRAVMNLLGNAVKFTEEGSITVTLKPVDSCVELSVADTGVGIPAEDLPHIFEEFRQVERQVGDKTEGTGLGLAIAKKSVDMLGGTISAESEVGKGTTFTVRVGDYET